jgi:hypothetical protein
MLSRSMRQSAECLPSFGIRVQPLRFSLRSGWRQPAFS